MKSEGNQFAKGNDLKPSADWIVFTVVNKDYVLLADKWARTVNATSGISPVFACADQEAYRHLSELNHHFMDHSIANTHSSNAKDS